MKYLRNTLLMILAATLIMPSPLVLAEGVSGATQESKVDDVQTVDNSLKSAEEAKDSVVDKEQIDSNSPSQSSENPETPTENLSTNSPSENPVVNESSKSEPNPESEPPKTDNSDKSTEENAPILISKISQDKKYVEMYNPTNQNVNLAGWKVEYYAGSGAKTVGKIAKTVGKIFKDEVISANEFLVLSNDKILAGAIKFDNNLGLAQNDGSVVLLRSDGSVADTVGWGNNSKSAGSPIKGGVKIVWRCFIDENIIDSKFLSGKNLNNQEIVPYSRPNCKSPEPNPESSKELNKCEGLKLNEIASNVDEQFIEIINSGEKTVITTGCKLTVGDSGVRENIGDIELNPGEFLTIKIKNTKLKLPKTKGKVYLLDEAGSQIDSTEYEKLAKSSSWSLVDDEWMQTFMITENSENIFKEYLDCQSGYERTRWQMCENCHPAS